MEIKINKGKIFDCSAVENKCKLCPHRAECDFEWIAKMYNDNSRTIGSANVIQIKDDLRHGRVFKINDHDAFLSAHNTIRKGTTTANTLCVSPECRGQGLGPILMDYVNELYMKPLFFKCLEDSSSNTYWMKHATLVGKDFSRKSHQPLNCYIYGKDYKEKLW